jgi:hypothetical protein
MDSIIIIIIIIKLFVAYVAKYKAESVHFRRVSSSMTPHQLHV